MVLCGGVPVADNLLENMAVDGPEANEILTFCKTPS
jgi:hypothetical protein